VASSTPAALEVAVHFSRHPNKRTVRLNAWTYHEGDSPAPDIRIESIMPRGVVLSHRNGVFRRFVPAAASS
jgi:hypothetical protein